MIGPLRFRVVDCETTGIPNKDDAHALVELGWTDVLVDEHGIIVLEPRAHLVNPGRPILPEASAVHGLRNVDVDGAPPASAVVPLVLAAATPSYFVAHKNEFDQGFIGSTGEVPWLCSHKVALRALTEAPLHSVQGLRYVLGVDDDPLFVREFAEPKHRAGPDSYVAAWVFARLVAEVPVEKMLHWSSGPALLITCYLNKHRGKRWADVARDDPSYLTWITEKSDIDDRDIRATARYWLKQRTPSNDSAN